MKILENKKIKAVIFDLDGTLIDSTSLWQDVDRRYLARFGIAFEENVSEEIKTMTFNESARYFIERFNIPRSEDEIKSDWNEMVLEEYRDHVQCKEGVHRFLHALASHGIKMCVATSCNKEHAILALERLNILNYFAFVRTCSEAGKNKEFPDLFLQCAEMMEIDPEACYIVEDLYMALKVANDVGFHTIGVLDDLNKKERDKIVTLCNYHVSSFIEILE